MPLQLKTVPPGQGARWMRDGFRLFGRYPIAFSALFAAFLFAVLLSSIVPFVGPVLMLASLPLLSLGFMVASEAALSGQPVHPGLYLAPLRRDPARRRSLLLLCLWYGAATLLIVLLADWVDGGAFEKLQRLLAAGAPQAEIDGLLDGPGLVNGLLVRFGLATLLSIPFWHAPALVHWGGQGPGQALFSSTLAVWRARGAFAVYLFAWCAIIVVFGGVTALLLGLLGTPQLAGIVALPAALIFMTVFYVSLLFTFNDSFGGTGGDLPAP